MTKKTKSTSNSTPKTTAEETQTFESEGYTSNRPARRKVYKQMKESDIPTELRQYFDKKGYALRFIRWSLVGEEDLRYLNKRQTQDGFEFVTKEEIPSNITHTLTSQGTKGMLTNGGDLCLMKVDKDFQQSRKEFFDGKATAEINSVDINVTGKKKGLRNVGSKSKVMLNEPTFQS